MNRILSKSLVAAGLSAGLVLAGCGSDAGNGDGNTGTTDTAGSDASGSTDTAGGGGGSDTTGGSDATDAGTTDTAVDPCSKCADNQNCVDDGAGGKKCEDKKPPCGGPCATGEICDTVTDKCVKPTCALPDAADLTGNKNINKVSKLALLDEKTGCDLDDDGVPNNVLGKIVGLYAQVNDTISGAVKDGSIVILLAPQEFKSDGTEFTCDLLLGDIDPSTKDCDATAAGACKYTVAESSYNQLFAGTGKCPALVTFDPVTVKDGKLKAGGDKQNFDLNLPVVGINLKLRISRAQLSGDQSDATSWKNTTNGMLCGVIAEDDLNAAIDAVPDELLAETGFDKATIKGLISSLLKSDIDTDGDGTNDAISVGLSLETFNAEVTGFTAK